VGVVYTEPRDDALPTGCHTESRPLTHAHPPEQGAVFIHSDDFPVHAPVIFEFEGLLYQETVDEERSRQSMSSAQGGSSASGTSFTSRTLMSSEGPPNVGDLPLAQFNREKSYGRLFSDNNVRFLLDALPEEIAV
jgi:hypothetical protein